MFIKSNLIGISFLLLLSFTFKTANAQETGAIKGTVYTAKTGEPLTGVSILIKGPQTGTATNEQGRFTFRNLPEDDYILIFKYLGFETKKIEVEVDEEETETVEVELERKFQKLEEVTVTGIRQGQAAALNEKKNAGGIESVISSKLMETFANPSAGAALKFIGGVNLDEDMGQARYVRIRGMSPDLVNVALNGVKTGSPEGDTRAVTLDMIPAGLLSKMSVSKSLTPDQSMDAIGGAVNLVTKSALTENRLLSIKLSGLYNDKMQQRSKFGGRVSAAYGQRLGEDNQLGFRVGVMHSITPIGNNDLEAEYVNDPGESNFNSVAALELRDYIVTRYSTGVNLNLDYRFNKDSKLYFNGFYNHFKDDQYQYTLALEADAAGRGFENRIETNKLLSLQIGGEHYLGDRWEVSYQLAYSYAAQSVPGVEYGFEKGYNDETPFIKFNRQQRPRFPKFSLTQGLTKEYIYGTYENWALGEIEYEDEASEERRYVPKIDMYKHFTLGSSIKGTLQFGVKASFVEKGQNNIVGTFEPVNDVGLAGFIGDYTYENYLEGKYAPYGIGYFPTEETIKDFFNVQLSSWQDYNPNNAFEIDKKATALGSNAEDYQATEKTYAGYLMTTLQIGKLEAIVGARYVYLASEYTANKVLIDKQKYPNQPQGIGIEKVSSEETTSFILPSINLKYNINTQNILRFAWTLTYARPSVFDIVPRVGASRSEEEISLGNPELDIARAMNLDFTASHYFSNIGIASVNLFYKYIDNYIYPTTFLYDGRYAEYKGFEATKPINGDYANLYGIGLSFQNQLTFLPGVLSGIGIYANYTYIYSEAYSRIQVSPNNYKRVKMSFPGQAGSTGSVSISYQRGGFNGRVSYTFNDAYIVKTRKLARPDRIYAAHQELSVSMSQQFSSHWTIFLQGSNLTNEPLVYYNGVRDRPEQQEYYSFGIKLGLEYNL